MRKSYKKFKLEYNKQSVEEVLIQRAVRTTIQIFYDKGYFDKCANADKVFPKDFAFVTRRIGDL